MAHVRCGVFQHGPLLRSALCLGGSQGSPMLPTAGYARSGALFNRTAPMKHESSRHHIQVGILEVGSFNTDPTRLLLGPSDVVAVVWETPVLQWPLIQTILEYNHSCCWFCLWQITEKHRFHRVLRTAEKLSKLRLLMGASGMSISELGFEV